MKKLNQIIFIWLTIVIISCNKKEGDAILTGPSLVGKWKDTGVKGTITIDFLGQKATEPLDVAPMNDIVEFKNDGTIVNFGGSDSDLKITKYKNTTTQLTFSGTQDNKAFDLIFNFKLNGTALLLTLNKELFSKNAFALSAAGVDSDLADFKEFASFITDIKYEQTLIKQ